MARTAVGRRPAEATATTIAGADGVMGKPIEVTEAILMEALRAARRSDPRFERAARTTAELYEVMGMGEKRLRRALHSLKRKGRLLVGLVERTSLDGRRIAVQGYSVLPECGRSALAQIERAAPKARTHTPRTDTPRVSKRARPAKRRRG